MVQSAVHSKAVLPLALCHRTPRRIGFACGLRESGSHFGLRRHSAATTALSQSEGQPSHKKAQKAQKKCFVLLVPLCGHCSLVVLSCLSRLSRFIPQRCRRWRSATALQDAADSRAAFERAAILLDCAGTAQRRRRFLNAKFNRATKRHRRHKRKTLCCLCSFAAIGFGDEVGNVSRPPNQSAFSRRRLRHQAGCRCVQMFSFIWAGPVRPGSARGRAEQQPGRLCSPTKPLAWPRPCTPRVRGKGERRVWPG